MEELPQFNDCLLSITSGYPYRKNVAPSERPLPVATPDMLMKSAKLSQPLLNDAKKVIDTFALSKPFAQRLMTAAQESNKTAVTAMIRKTGVQTVPDIVYNPDGIRLDFYPKIGEDFCHVIVSLKWGSI